jgi:uncharacterized membrane protein YfcA
MNSLNLAELIFFCLIIIISYAIRGSAGFGGITVPLLAWILSLKTVIPMVTFLGLISSALIIRTEYRLILWNDLKKILPWTAIGVALGIYFFRLLNALTIARILGCIVFIYGAYAFIITYRPIKKIKLPMQFITPFAGTLAGYVGTLFGSMAGIFYAIYFDLLKPQRDHFRATVAAILFALGILRGTAYIATGEFTPDVQNACALAIPMMILGTVIGNKLQANLNDTSFKRLVAVILIISAIPLLIKYNLKEFN